MIAKSRKINNNNSDVSAFLEKKDKTHEPPICSVANADIPKTTHVRFASVKLDITNKAFDPRNA
jgi:hypothetical protein